MKTTLMRAALACAMLAITATAALAADDAPFLGNKPILEGNDLVTGPCMPPYNCIADLDLTVRNVSGEVVQRGRTNEEGALDLRIGGTSAGTFYVDIGGDSLIAAMDKLTPPPKKESSGSSFGLSLGGVFGGGSSRAAPATQGAGPIGGGGGAARGGSRSSSGGGVGVGLDIPIGGGGGMGKPSGPVGEMVTLTATVTSSGGTPTGTVQFLLASSQTPYCRDTAGQGMRIGFSAPPGGSGPVGIVVRIAHGHPIEF